MNNEYIFKILLVGPCNSGKSSILIRYIDDKFKTNYASTIGIDFKIKSLTLNNVNLKLQIWDTAGQEKFRSITSAYYRGANGVIIVFDLTDKNSYYQIEKWHHHLLEYCHNDFITIIVGNKLDCNRREISDQEIKLLTEKLKAHYIEVSAKENINIDFLFLTLVDKLLATGVATNHPKSLSSTLNNNNSKITNKCC